MHFALLQWAHDLDGWPCYFETQEQLTDHVLKYVVGKKRSQDYRLEAVSNFDVYKRIEGKLVKAEDTYVPQTPSAALTYELHLSILGTAEWNERFKDYDPALEWYEDDVYIVCNNPAERLLLADHFAAAGVVEIGGEQRVIDRIALYDRVLLLDNQWTFRRSRLGSQRKQDRELGKQLRPLIEQLVNNQRSA